MKKNSFRKYFKLLFLSIQPIVILPFAISLNEIVNNNKIEKKENNEVINNKNYQTDFEITPVYKSGKDKMVWLFYGEGYTKDQQSIFLNKVKGIVENIFNVKPFDEFTNLINIYAVNVISDNEWIVGDNHKKTYFGSYVNSASRVINLNYFGSLRLEILRNQIIENYLDPGAVIMENTILANSDSYYAGTNFQWYSVLTTQGVSLETLANGVIHEAAHGFASLTDEYIINSSSFLFGPNRSITNDLKEVPWNKFVGYKNVGAYKVDNSYIPVPFGQCIMSNHIYGKFCPVCEYEVHKNLNMMANNYEKYFIAKPELTVRYNSNLNINTIKLTTMFKNYTNENKKIKIVFKNKDNLFDEKIFDINSNKLEQLSYEKQLTGFNSQDSNDLIAEFIDLNTNKIFEKVGLNSDTKYFDININFKIIDKNEYIPNLGNTKIKIKEGDDYILDAPNFEGYEFVKSSENKNLSNVNSNKTIDYFYKPIDKKDVVLVLKDDKGKEVIRKKSIVYKNGLFVPNRNDFVVNYGWLVDPINKEYKYEDIVSQQEIQYIRRENYPRIELKQKDFPLGERVPALSMINIYKLNGKKDENFSSVEYMDYEILWDKEGTYPIDFWYTDKFFNEDNIQIERKKHERFFINVVGKGEINNDHIKAQEFINKFFVNSFTIPTKNNVDKIINGKSEYDKLNENIKTNIDKIISEDNTNYPNFNSYTEIFNITKSFLNKMELLLEKNLKINNSYINYIDSETYKKIINFESEFNNLQQNEKEYVDYKLGTSYLQLLNKSKNYNPTNENVKNNNFKSNLWWIILISITIPLLIISFFIYLFLKNKF